jgi:endogenous inhibitor of DNA gyrase (YacG/DUF329 family)
MRGKTRRQPAPSTCPVCGADVPSGARACPECGADERTGWDDENTRYDGIDLPGESFGGDEASGDGDTKKRSRRGGLPLIAWLVGAGILILAVALVVAGLANRGGPH